MLWKRLAVGVLAGLEKILNRALGVVGAIVGAQLPEFMQQYRQQLVARLDEARRLLANFAQVAHQAGLSLEQYLARLAGNPDPVASQTGRVIRNLSQRVDDLAAAELAWSNASGWTRPFAFGRHFDREIARSTWSVFRPAVPTTMEGVIYAGGGLALALVVYHFLIKGLLRVYFRRDSVKLGDPAGRQ